MKIYSWNVNGIRAVQKKNALMPFLEAEKPDILCLQEVKATEDQAALDLDGYRAFWYASERPGYSGTAILSRVQPLQTVNGFPKDIIGKYSVTGDTFGDPNLEGRVIAAEFEGFWLVTVYTPNAKDDLGRLELRHKQWDPAFLAYVKGLETGKYPQTPERHGLDEVQGAAEQQTAAVQRSTAQRAAEDVTKQFAKPVVFCGDLNVAHTELDLANPKPNVGKKGFTDEEREGFQSFVDAGFVDTLRMFKEGNGYYTWWSHFAKSRERNVGWRIDYFMVSESLKSKVQAADIHPAVMGSDHCPISVTLNI